MSTERLAVSDVASMIGIDRSTLGRSLEAAAFSRSVARRLREIIGPAKKRQTVDSKLRNALRLIAASDRLRQQADRLLNDALDLTRQTK